MSQTSILLTPSQHALLTAIANGQRLKDHRNIEGEKIYRLYPIDGDAQAVLSTTVATLIELDLISSNKKFPAATYWLTEKGQRWLKPQ